MANDRNRYLSLVEAFNLQLQSICNPYSNNNEENETIIKPYKIAFEHFINFIEHSNFRDLLREDYAKNEKDYIEGKKVDNSNKNEGTQGNSNEKKKIVDGSNEPLKFSDVNVFINQKIKEFNKFEKRTDLEKVLANVLKTAMENNAERIFKFNSYNKKNINQNVNAANSTFSAQAPNNQKSPAKCEEKGQQKIEATLLMKFINYASEVFAYFKESKQDNKKTEVHAEKMQASTPFYRNPQQGVALNYTLSVNR